MRNTWKRRVEQVPLIDPAKNAFTIGLIPVARSRPDIVLGYKLVTHLNSQKDYTAESQENLQECSSKVLWGVRVVLILATHRDVGETSPDTKFPHAHARLPGWHQLAQNLAQYFEQMVSTWIIQDTLRSFVLRELTPSLCLDIAVEESILQDSNEWGSGSWKIISKTSNL